MKNEKLSLCVIVGNVENYIARFIESFKPLADEIVIVRAIGNQAPDKTVEIADSLGAKIAPGYINQDEHDEWPHVDDFAAARQMAFNAASHDLIMWADTDDVIDPESIKRIRETIDLLPEDFDGIQFAYHVPEDQLTVNRERIIRKGRAVWASPIHEYLQFDKEPKLATVNGAVILHRPEGTRERNDERNLRILESIEHPTTSHKFHLFQSLRAVGRINEAATVVCELLKSNDENIGTAEKYELFIAAGQMADNVDIRLQMNLQALSVDPSRKEAYGELCLCYIGLGRNKDALAITTAMLAQDGGSSAWNVRRKYSGYLGYQLHGMALRANNRDNEADEIETAHFIQNGKKISLIHATRGRCKQAVEARRRWFNKAKNPDAIEHIFGLDSDDPHGAFLNVHNHVATDGKGGCVAAWNAAAEKSCGEVLVQLSDDWDPPMHWDEILLNAIGDTSESKVLAISDGHRTDNLLCMAILTRARYEQQGYMFHFDFFSVYSDNYFTDKAYADGVIIEARDIIFEHLHPVFGKAEWDETYARSNSDTNYQNGKATYERLLAETA
jgi:glycosyltransferase involved in cell wall biosynthesis